MTDEQGLIRALEQSLGIAVIVRSVEPGPPARIEATFMLDSRSSDVAGVGESEAEAWQDLARAAVAWRNDDGMNVRIFGGG